jgi:hypothetical protein
VARRAEDLDGGSIVDVIDDGLDDDAVASAFAEWLDSDGAEPIELPIRASDELKAAREAGEV